MYSWGKRLFDYCAAAAGLLLLAPLLLAVAVAAWLGGLRPVLFWQWRTGYREQPFQVLKFRTMTQRTNAVGTLLPDAERLTPLGEWLRRTSLDELPQLWNVLRGELSLVGPRPFIHSYLPLYSEAQRVRFRVRPGLTGWAQVNGRNALSWEEKFALDSWYVANQSLALDLRILWRTLGRVLSGHAVSAAGHATTAPFRGSKAALGKE
ncbi:sugar transferase [Hymenobacter sp. HMF4947]|uniref:Sugar transferase n=2 Tax=Hymenobacter ginkgonis TaxID=2682976 RepID=A0A7K1TL49_9BACT|nr:sugar transferase [Hymenobacter ginkgonis]